MFNFEEKYLSGEAIITDFEYDRLELPKQPNIVKSMLTLYSYEKLQEYISKFEEIIIEPKIDGMSAILIYKNGLLTQAFSKGKVKPNDIIQSILFVDNIPKNITFTDDLIVRGELIINKQIFEKKLKINFQHVRSCVCGAILGKDKNKIIDQEIKFVAFSFTYLKSIKYSDDKQFFSQFFEVTPTLEYSSEPEKLINEINTSYDYLCDGIVFKENIILNRKKLGSTQTDHRWEIAFKKEEEIRSTIVEKIEFVLSKTGKHTPILYVQTVIFTFKNNLQVNRINLGSFSSLNNKLGKDSKISITIKSLAIPVLKEILEPCLPENIFQPITNCISCNSILTKKGYCLEDLCKQKMIMNLSSTFIILGMKSISTSAALKFIQNNVNDILDLLELNEDTIFKIFNYSKKSYYIVDFLKHKTINWLLIISCLIQKIPMLTSKHLLVFQNLTFKQLLLLNLTELEEKLGKIKAISFFKFLNNLTENQKNRIYKLVNEL